VGSQPPDDRQGADGVVVVPDVGPDARVEPLVRATIARSVAQLQEREPGVCQGDDPEDVHKFRVATRRLRSDLRTFRKLLDRDWVAGLRGELKWLGGEIGAVRDADVLLDRLRRQVDELGEPLAGAAQPLLVVLTDQRAAAHAELVAALGSTRYQDLVALVVAAAAHPVFADESRAGKRALVVAPKLVRPAWRRLHEGVDDLPDEPSDHELHAVRILAKRARYAAEAVVPVVGEPAKALAAAITEVQTVLGDHQDTVVAETWLRATAKQRPELQDPVDALVDRETDERRTHRAAFPAAWQAATAPELHRWLD
jgi:CHAD domain-containing protein